MHSGYDSYHSCRVWGDVQLSSEIIVGFADIDPADTAPSRLTDSNPIFGSLSDAVDGNRIEILDGLAIGKLFVITNINVPQDRFVVDENLFDEGVRLGLTKAARRPPRRPSRPTPPTW